MSYHLGRREPMRPAGSPEELERRRRRAMRLLDDGYAPVDVAPLGGVDRCSGRGWKPAYPPKATAALAAKPAAGRPPKLDARAQRRLERLLVRGAQAAGF